MTFERGDRRLKMQNTDSDVLLGQRIVDCAHSSEQRLKRLVVRAGHGNVPSRRPGRCNSPCQKSSAPDRRIKSRALQVSALPAGTRSSVSWNVARAPGFTQLNCPNMGYRSFASGRPRRRKPALEMCCLSRATAPRAPDSPPTFTAYSRQHAYGKALTCVNVVAKR